LAVEGSQPEFSPIRQYYESIFREYFIDARIIIAVVRSPQMGFHFTNVLR
jgi:hypothetical protein